MRRILGAAALATAMLAAQAIADEENATTALGIELAHKSGVVDAFDASIAVIIDGTRRQIAAGGGVLRDEDDIEVFMETFEAEMRARLPDLVAPIGALFSARFSDEEMRELVTFLETPLGRKFAEAGAEWQDDYAFLFEVWLRKAAVEARAKAMERLKERSEEG